MKTRRNILILLIIPALVMPITWYLLGIRGPYYSGMSADPTYAYLYNILLVADGHAPALFQHPGVTVDILGAVALYARWFLALLSGDSAPLVDSVLKNPESYIFAVQTLFNLLFSAALFFAGFQFLKYSKRLLPAIVLQVTPFFYMETLRALIATSPEPLLMAGAVMLTAALIPEFFADGEEGAEEGKKWAILAGVSLGFGMATKVTFLPLFLFLFLLPGWRKRIIALVSCCASFLILMLPLWGRFKGMVNWLWNNFSHTGNYGAGKAGFVGVNELVSNLVTHFTGNLFLFGSFAAYIIVLLFFQRLRREHTGGVPSERFRRLFIVGSLVIAAQIGLALKQPASRYLLPAMASTSFVTAAALLCLLQSSYKSSAVKFKVNAAILIFVALGAIHGYLTFAAWRTFNIGYRAQVLNVEQVIEKNADCTIVRYHSASHQIYAMNFGSMLSNNVYGKKLFEMYPNEIFYQVWGKIFTSLVGTRIEKKEIADYIKSGGCIVMTGYQFSYGLAGLDKGLLLKPVYEKRYAAAYILEGFDGTIDGVPKAEEKKLAAP